MSLKIRIFPTGKSIEVKKGSNLRKVIHEAGFTLESPCAGHGVCLKCGVVINGIAPRQSQEGKTLELERENRGKAGAVQALEDQPSGKIEGRWVLACQTDVLEPGDVLIPATKTIDYKAAFSRFSRVAKLKPNLHRIPLNLPHPSLEDQKPDWQRLKAALVARGFKPLSINLTTLAGLPGKLRAADFNVEAVVLGERLVEVRPAGEVNSVYGVAVDIGTTSVAAILVDLASGWIKGVESILNEQVAFGLDVISRIDYASRGSENLKELQRRIVRGINHLIGQLCQEHKIKLEDVYELVAVGNTTMIHLFLGMEARNLALCPYIGASTGAHSYLAREIGVDIHPEGEVYVLPGIASFVGSDTVGVILATHLNKYKKTVLAIDLGTNGEVALVHQGQLWVASTAAGPAFEGGGIHHGMRAVEGAISSFSIEEGEISYRVIGNVPPKGICGSGLIDLVASLYRAGIINNTGRLLSPSELGEADAVTREVIKKVRERDNKREFVIYSDYYGREVVLTQQDVRQLQLAKGAVHAAIMVLKKLAGLEDRDIGRILLAGTFGNYVNAGNAFTIGLLPKLTTKDVRFIGNAALEGAMKALVNSAYRKRAYRVTKSARYIELSGRSDFQEEFIQSLDFGS